MKNFGVANKNSQASSITAKRWHLKDHHHECVVQVAHYTGIAESKRQEALGSNK